jgi:CHAT domain-containing protein
MAWLSQWIKSYGAFEREGQSAIPAWSRTLDRLSLELGEAIWAPMRDALNTTNTQRIIIIPDLWLDALPLNAMSLDRKPDREFFAGRYQVGYCPSLRMLARSMQRPESIASRAIFLGNPQAVCPTRECSGRCTLSLPSADAELASLRENWPEVESLMGSEVTVARFLEIISRVKPSLLHVCAHGLTRFDDPLASGFLCALDDPAKDHPLVVYLNHELGVTWGTNASGEVLTLDALLRCADLRRCRLAVLNACEMGLGWIGNPREIPSIANGFLAGGVPTVIAPLWPIAAPAARLLTSRFYAELRHDPRQKLRALTNAQRWLNSVTRREAEKLVPHEQIDAGALVSGEDRPFSHPFFWAPFRLLGNPL